MTALLLALTGFALAGDPPPPPPMIGERDGNTWTVPVDGPSPIRVPRVCASLRSATFAGMPERSVVVHPEIEYWELRFDGPAPAKQIVLEFDSPPLLPSEAKPVEQAGDGTLTLPAARGITTGEKLRFEPQPQKNTIGYWVNADDLVTWTVRIDRPGAFNVGLLQGAGEKGGGTAEVSLRKNGEVVDSLSAEVPVTGHFQNFRWRHVGTLTAAEAGAYELRIAAEEIPRNALMDVRQVHLSPAR